MIKTTSLAAVLSAVLAASFPCVAEDETPPALKGLDPVELTRGKETPGDPAIDVVHGRFRYAFASEKNRSLFESTPERFRIQMGGGCGRMGPLSGKGSPDRFAVHDGLIYIFASESCRTNFLKDPAAHIDRNDPLPEGKKTAKERGGALVERAVKAAGGAQAIDAAKTYVERRERTVESGDETQVNVRRLLIAYPDKVRAEDAWNDRLWTFVAAGGDGFLAGPERVEPMDESQVAFLRREAHRSLVSILKARKRSDFVAVAIDEEGDAKIARVAVAFDGTTTTLGIDRDSGRIVTASWRGRAGAGHLGAMAASYSDFRNAGALVLPAARDVTFEGRRVDALSGTFEISVDAALEPALFAR